MASITFRNLDEPTKAKLRVRAAHHKRSMEEDLRNILPAALSEETPAQYNLAAAVQRRFQPLGGVELELPPRDPLRDPSKHRKRSSSTPTGWQS